MGDTAARQRVLEALRGVASPAARDEHLARRFLEGDPVRLDELELDSLAVMEFCIALEAQGARGLTPDVLARLGHLAAVAARLPRRPT